MGMGLTDHLAGLVGICRLLRPHCRWRLSVPASQSARHLHRLCRRSCPCAETRSVGGRVKRRVGDGLDVLAQSSGDLTTIKKAFLTLVNYPKEAEVIECCRQ